MFHIARRRSQYVGPFLGDQVGSGTDTVAAGETSGTIDGGAAAT